MLAVKRKPETVSAAFRREEGLAGMRRYAQALALLDALLARSDLTARQRLDAMCRKADCLEHLFRPGEALGLMRAITRKFPNEALGFSLLGEYTYRVCGDCRGALRALRRSLKLNPSDAESLWWTGQILQYGLARFKRARRYFLAALSADPEYGPAMESLARLAEAEAKWIEAIDWRKAHYRSVRRPEGLVALAELYLRVGNPPAARKYARQAALKAKGSASAWLTLAKAKAAEGHLRGALRALRRVRRLADLRAGPAVSTNDLAFLEPALRLKGARAIFRRLAAT